MEGQQEAISKLEEENASLKEELEMAVEKQKKYKKKYVEFKA